MSKKVTLSVVVVLLAASMLACQMTSLFPTPTATAVPVLPVSSTTTDLSNQQDRLMTIYQQFSPGVVSIRTTTAQGSGWVYSGDGVIVTNNHVVGTETRVEVDFASGLKTYGDVVGTDAYSDLAVIKVDVAISDLHPLPLGNSDILQVGQTVIAIGNPFGLSGTMTTGIISALGRSLPTSSQGQDGGYFSNADIIQTDTALNPGNSGGPLLNLNGEVIGINSAIETTGYTTGGEPLNSGIGFAISINTVKRVVPSLIQNGKFDYAYLGISTRDDLPLTVIEALGLKSTSGAYVTSVLSGGPSDQAGIQAGTQPLDLPGYQGLNKGGDLVIAIDGQPVVTFDDMIRYLALHKSPGEPVTLTVLRGDQQLDVSVVLGKRP
ncbi:MAG: trypsin-like peptidase domain-containing protein [Anaerolineales bacterium]|nr:trypsin-like peptidase domain-containing protein [Anaerolineales bacterium]